MNGPRRVRSRARPAGREAPDTGNATACGTAGSQGPSRDPATVARRPVSQAHWHGTGREKRRHPHSVRVTRTCDSVRRFVKDRRPTRSEWSTLRAGPRRARRRRCERAPEGRARATRLIFQRLPSRSGPAAWDWEIRVRASWHIRQ